MTEEGVRGQIPEIGIRHLIQILYMRGMGIP
jgi:hypothetical protein